MGWQYSWWLSVYECGRLGLLWGNGAEVDSGKRGAQGSCWVCRRLCSAVDVGGVGEGCVDRVFGAGAQGK